MSKDLQFNEVEALLKLSHGDEVSFKAIYNKYSPVLYLRLIRMLKSNFLAEDILQDVFITVWNNRKKIDKSKCFQGYISSIAVHKCYDHFRKIARTHKLYSKLQIDETQPASNDQLLINKEESIVLFQTIALLPPKRKLIFNLCKVDGKSYEEVSNQLGISISTISDHIVKANSFIRFKLFPSIA